MKGHGSNQLYFIGRGQNHVLVVAGSKEKAVELSPFQPEKLIIRKWDGRKNFHFGDAWFRPSEYMELKGGHEHLVETDIFLSSYSIAKLKEV